MSLQELKFYKCKRCKEVDLVAGKYCIDCSKKEKLLDTALNTKGKTIGHPFIQRDECSNIDDLQGTRTDTTASSTDFPIWTNFTSAGNATNTLDTSTFATVSGGTVMDFGALPSLYYGQDRFSRQRKKTKHQ